MIKTNTILQGDALKVLKTFPDESVDCIITSPPYWGLRDYGIKGQIGLEKTPEEYVAKLVKIFGHLNRVLKKQGTLWLNLGDSYASAWACSRRSIIGQAAPNLQQRQKRIPRGSGRWGGGNNSVQGLKEKDLIGIPWRVAFALQADGWYLRQDIIWSKPNPMPESVTDRCTKSHEYIFLLTKSKKYYYDSEAVKEPLAPASIARLSQDLENQKGSERVPGKTNGNMKAVRGKGSIRPHSSERVPSGWHQSKTGRGRHPAYGISGTGFAGHSENVLADGKNYSKRNKRSVWTITTKPYKEAHFATFPEALIETPIKAGCPKGGIVLDPFFGSGTTGLVAQNLGRLWLGIEINPKYIKIAQDRLRQQPMIK